MKYLTIISNSIVYLLILSLVNSQDYSSNLIKKYNPNLNYVSKLPNNSITLSLNSSYIFNTGHNNLDNNAEIFSPGSFSRFNSFMFSISYPWFHLILEPYSISHSNIFYSSPVRGPYHFSNHSTRSIKSVKTRDIRQSEVILHYKGFGISYGKKSHWWGPGFHSSISLSSNAPSQETFSIGTFNELRIRNFGFSSKLIAMPYKSSVGNQLYFSGLKSQITYYSNPIITVGFNRVYLSGNLPGYTSENWDIYDAIQLVIEPLFGQEKKGLDYTIEGTPGFDYWDEILSGYIKLFFPKDKIEFYIDLSSDDSRANFVDLRAHWDHTLGYQVGIIKHFDLSKNNYFIASEYTSTRESNSFKSSFFRANPNALNYYAKGLYDFSTYEGRFLGAHSGSSSTDMIIIAGIINDRFTTLFSINREQNGIKVQEYPEQKNEISILYQRKINNHHAVFLKYEYEKISNFRFIENKVSISRLFWIGYTFTFSK